jgi:hypothetical protein
VPKKHFAHWSLPSKALLQVEVRVLKVPSLHCLDEQHFEERRCSVRGSIGASR